MKNILNLFISVIACFWMIGCAANSPTSNTTPNSSVSMGTLPNGSIVSISNNNIPIAAGKSTPVTLSIGKGTTNDSFNIVFGNTMFSDANGVTITPSQCTLDTSKTTAQSCVITINAVSTTVANIYNVPVTAKSISSGTTTTLSSIILLISAPQSDSSNAINTFLLNGVAGVINGNNITVKMPNGTNLTSLIATYVTTGNSIAVNGVTQANGVTGNNFSKPLVYSVAAINRSVQNYTVTVTTGADSSANFISLFSLNGVAGVITGNNISVIMPLGTNLTSLLATFISDGVVTVGGVPQVSGVTLNNFTNVQTYAVKAANGSIRNYTVEVTLPQLVSITVTPVNPSIKVAVKQQFTATGNYTNSTTQDLTALVNWSSSNISVATVGATTGLATGIAVGNTAISATLANIVGSTTLTITPAVLQSITITPVSASVGVGGMRQFIAIGNYSDSTTQNLTTSVNWSSSPSNIATVLPNAGFVSGVAAGTATISATFGGVAGSVVLSVNPTSYIYAGTSIGAIYRCPVTNPAAGTMGACVLDTSISASNQIFSLSGSSVNGYLYGVSSSSSISMFSCPINASGVVQSCSFAPQSLINTNGIATYYSYLGVMGLIIQDVPSQSVQKTTLTPLPGGFTNAGAVLNSGKSIAVTTINNIRYVYAAGVSFINYATLADDGTIGAYNTFNAAGANLNSPYGIIVSNNVLYFVNNVGGLSACSIATGGGYGGSCAVYSSVGTGQLYQPAILGGYLYIGDGSSIKACPITSGSTLVGTCVNSGASGIANAVNGLTFLN